MPIDSATTRPQHRYTVRICSGGIHRHGGVYEDDGHSLAFESGMYANTSFAYTFDGKQLSARITTAGTYRRFRQNHALP